MDDQALELLEMYIEMTERQDEIISRMSRIIARQATDLANMRAVLNSEVADSDPDPDAES